MFNVKTPTLTQARLVVAVALLLAATPTSAYRFLGLGKPSPSQRGKYRHGYANGSIRWVRLSRAQRRAYIFTTAADYWRTRPTSKPATN